MSEKVNHPAHYQSEGGIECIDYIESLGMGEGFELGNAIKYIARAGKKETEEATDDLKKAIWYIKRYMSTTLGVKFDEHGTGESDGREN